MKTTLMALCLALLGCAAQAGPVKPMKEFIDELMARMTLREKIGQLNLLPGGDITTGCAMETQVGALIAAGDLGGVFNIKGVARVAELQRIAVERSRLGIPLLVGMDVVHGYETVFPIPLALACSWDVEAVERSAAVAAREASADGVCWTFSPMVDVALDARWGRVAEGGGEDPFLGAAMGAAMVRGYQGDLSARHNILACVKHFALYGAVEGGLEYNTVDMSRLRMYNQYLAPYRAAVEAGAGSVMSSFNVVDGVPAATNRWLLTDVLRGQWGFGGFVVTDYGAIGETLIHGTAGSLAEAAEAALRAGTDMDMCSGAFAGHLARGVAEGRVRAEEVDSACRRVLEAKYRLGLFADPYKYCDGGRAARELYSAENRRVARETAAKTFVLLKNDGGLLPLRKEGVIALIGPLAESRNNMAGTWSVAQTPERYSTLRQAMERAVAGRATVVCAQGCNVWRDERLQRAGEFDKPIARGDAGKMRAEALAAARRADVVVCAMGETADMSGESGSRTSLEMPDAQMELLRELVALGKPVVLLNFAGRPTVLAWESAHVAAILNVWFGGSEAGDAICDVLFGDSAPSGRLAVSMPRATGQAPLYYNHLSTGRPVAEGAREFKKYMSNYLDVRNGALYPFGYGLTYTTLRYGKLRLSGARMARGGSVEATVEVSNTGSRDTDEVVQLYVRDRVASIARPVRELKAFRRVRVAAGGRREVTFSVTPEMLSFYNADLELVVEPGDFDIMVGPNCRDVQTAVLTVE